jgi:hypothetical protein
MRKILVLIVAVVAVVLTTTAGALVGRSAASGPLHRMAGPGNGNGFWDGHKRNFDQAVL